MSEQAKTGIQVVLVTALCLILTAISVWDVLMITRSQDHNTVSAVLRDWTGRYPELLLPIGYLLCHLFGR